MKMMAGDTLVGPVSDPETQQARQELATRVLKNIDASVDEILLQIPFAALYVPDIGEGKWKRADIEGSLYCAKRRNSPKYRLFILNKLNQTNFVEDISVRHEVELRKNYVFIWSPYPVSALNAKDHSLNSTRKTHSFISDSYAIWAYYKEKSSELCALLQSCITELRDESNEELNAAHQQFSEIVEKFKTVQPYDCNDGATLSTEPREGSCDGGCVTVSKTSISSASNGSALHPSISQASSLASHSQSADSRFAGRAIMKMLGVSEKGEVFPSSIGQPFVEKTISNNYDPLSKQLEPTLSSKDSFPASSAAVSKEGAGTCFNSFAEGMDILSVSLEDPVVSADTSVLAPSGEAARVSVNKRRVIENESKCYKTESPPGYVVHSSAEESKFKPNLLRMLKESNIRSHDYCLDVASADKRSSVDSEIKDELDSHLVSTLELLLNSKKSHNHIWRNQDERTKEFNNVMNEQLVDCFCNAMADVFQTKEFKNMLWNRLKLQ